jgi:hypothetical protein
MRTLFISALIAFLSLPSFLSAQDIKVHNYIGKSQSEVIKNYGNPIHKDASNPAMICMFYKSGTNTMIFVSNQEGVYQAEASVSYDDEKTARAEVNKLISTSLTNSYQVDSVTVSDYRLHKTGVKVDLQIYENKLTKKYDVKVKANKSG